MNEAQLDAAVEEIMGLAAKKVEPEEASLEEAIGFYEALIDESRTQIQALNEDIERRDGTA